VPRAFPLTPKGVGGEDGSAVFFCNWVAYLILESLVFCDTAMWSG